MNEPGKYRLDDFQLYQAARQMRNDLYVVINQLPAVEKYALGVQMRKAAVSISNNVAEGHGRWHYQENIRFCQIARGSLEESIDDLNTCLDQNYSDPDLLKQFKENAYSLVERINSYISYLRRCKQGDRE